MQVQTDQLEWKHGGGLVAYPDALAFMEQRVADIRAGKADEAIWLLEHPPLYTAGTSARDEDMLDPQFPVYETGRGGQYTYHGPGQRVAYAMLDLKHRQKTPDIKHFVWSLEEWIILTLAAFGVRGERREGRVGIWVDMQPYGGAVGQEAKIAAIGVRVRHWVTFHGISINVNPDLSHFGGIVPCGISNHGVTSMSALGLNATLSDVDAALKAAWPKVFS